MCSPVFLVVDRHFYHVDEAYKETRLPRSEREGIRIEGLGNVAIMCVVVALVPLIGLWESPVKIAVGPAHVALPDLVRSVLLVVLAGVSLIVTSASDRRENGFSWRRSRKSRPSSPAFSSR